MRTRGRKGKSIEGRGVTAIDVAVGMISVLDHKRMKG
jgi:hypothetical protein